MDDIEDDDSADNEYPSPVEMKIYGSSHGDQNKKNPSTNEDEPLLRRKKKKRVNWLF